MSYFRILFLVSVIAVGVIVFSSVMTVHAATVHYYVDPDGTDDMSHGTGPGADAWATIQYAVTNVANPTTDTIIINISGDTYITGNDDIDIDRNFTNLTLQGAGVASTIIKPHADPASATAGNIDIGASETVTISDMTIRDGYIANGNGSAILVAGSTNVTLRNCLIDDNDTGTSGNRGGIYFNNTNGVSLIENCTISNNDAPYAGGVVYDGSNSVNKLTNSTIFNNTGAYAANVGVGYQVTAILTNNTITKGGDGVAIFNSSFTAIYMKNNLIASSTTGISLDLNGFTAKVFGSNNVIETQDAAYFNDSISGNRVGTGLVFNMSATLADNGNTENGTQTIALSAGSVAIDAGSTSAHGPSGNQVTPPANDQRNAARSGTIDIGSYEYNGVIGDVVAPALSSVWPADGASAATTTTDLVISFDEAVDAETGNISIYKSSDDSLVEAIDVTSGQVTGSGSAIITVNPSVTLTEQTAYYVQIAATAFDDASGNSFAGISDTTTWNFTTGDFTNPVVATLSPADSAVDIALAANLLITFDEAVDAETGNISIYKSSDDSLVEAIDVTSGQVTGSGTTAITINPASDLEYSTSYYIQIAATAFDDASGNSFAGISDATIWSFTTVAAPLVPETSSGSKTGSSVATRVNNLMNMGKQDAAHTLIAQWPHLFTEQTLAQADGSTQTPLITTVPVDLTPTPVRDLYITLLGDDVKKLQTLLITLDRGPMARELARIGATGYFGTYTRDALAEYQKLNNISPSQGYFGAITRAQMKRADLRDLWW